MVLFTKPIEEIPTSYPEVQAKLEEIFYAIGMSPPNYPVPAICGYWSWSGTESHLRTLILWNEEGIVNVW